VTERLRVDPVLCDAHGLCAELVPELVGLDDWGFPIISDAPVSDDLKDDVRRAITACPVLALRLAEAAPAR
jgi:ferredoxin